MVGSGSRHQGQSGAGGLLGVANQCFLAMLGSAEIEAGHYQQIRVILADNSVSVNGNKCGSTANCLMLTSDPSNTPQPLQLSSESNTGIKIPSGQIAGRDFTVVREKPTT